jgi:hypothetical protein
MASARRATALKLLNLFGAHLTPPADAFMIRWQCLSSEELKRTMKKISAVVTRRQFNRLRRTLADVFSRTGDNGVISSEHAVELFSAIFDADGNSRPRHRLGTTTTM